MYLYRKCIDRNASLIRYYYLLYTACIFDHCEGESISLFECLQMGHGNLVVFQESIEICLHFFCCGVMSLHHSHSSLLRSKITLKRSQNTLKQAETIFQPSVYR